MKKLMYLFVSLALVALAACDGSSSADDPSIDLSAELTDNVYYVVGGDAQAVVAQDDGTAKCGIYLFISENLQDTVSVYNYTKDRLPGNLLDGVFEFPTEIMATNTCGFALFPEKYRYLYPVKINSHRPMTKTEEMDNFSVCNAMILPSPIHANKFIVVESLTKIE